MEIREIEPALEGFMLYLMEEEKSAVTIRQYTKDVKQFAVWAETQEIPGLTKESVITYKESMTRCYKPSTVNAKLCALNSFFSFAGCRACRVRLLKTQSENFVSDSRELNRQDYLRLMRAAEKKGDLRLRLIFLTMGCTGIRVSELSAITVEAVSGGEAVIHLKGKIRRILLPGKLCAILGAYADQREIKTGPIFITRGGRSVDRSNVWKMMKGVCETAGVSREKVFPHNIRHLFARQYYERNMDIAKLADILGHSSIETTRIYIRTTGAEERKQIEALGMLDE